MATISGTHKHSRTGMLVNYGATYQLNGSNVYWRGNVALADGVSRPLLGGVIGEVQANTVEDAVLASIRHEIDQTDWLRDSQMGELN